MELYTIGEFTEVFDTDKRETVYVSEDRKVAKEVMVRLEQGLEIPNEYLTAL